jgi:hypothetical protein
LVNPAVSEFPIFALVWPKELLAPELAILHALALPVRCGLMNCALTRFANSALMEVKVTFNTGLCFDQAALQPVLQVSEEQ